MAKLSLEYYLDRYTEGTITAAEWQALRVLLDDPEQANLFNQLLDLQLAAADPQKDELAFTAVTNRVVKAVEDSIRREEDALPVTEKMEGAAPIKKMINRWWWAAAAVLVLAINAYWWIPGKKEQSARSQVSLATGDAAPGREGAVLTLADGKQILLDDADAGLIAIQQGTDVKLEHGLLSYSAGTSHGQVYSTTSLNTMTTPRGRLFKLQLPDGTRVWLNAASSITYPTVFAGEQRQVQISGEVYFEVTKNRHQPFVVQLPGGGRVEVLGTHFNVNAYADEAAIRTTLLEGSVRVVQGESAATLLPGQQAESGANILVHEHFDTGQVMAWKNGWFNAEGADLKTVLRQLARWYDMDVEYTGPVSHQPFGGKIDRSLRLSQALSLLQTAGVQFRIEGKKLIVAPQ